MTHALASLSWEVSFPLQAGLGKLERIVRRVRVCSITSCTFLELMSHAFVDPLSAVSLPLLTRLGKIERIGRRVRDLFHNDLPFCSANDPCSYMFVMVDFLFIVPLLFTIPSLLACISGFEPVASALCPGIYPVPLICSTAYYPTIVPVCIACYPCFYTFVVLDVPSTLPLLSEIPLLLYAFAASSISW